MSLRKNISGGPLDVPLLGRQVEADETVEVPDFQPDSTDKDPLPIIWPENRWADADPPKPAKASAKTAADDTTGKAAV